MSTKRRISEDTGSPDAEFETREFQAGPPKKRTKWSDFTSANVAELQTSSSAAISEDLDDERCSDDERKDTTEPRCEAPVLVTTAATATPTTKPRTSATKGVILRSGRIRLPDKLIQYLNNEVAPSSLFWQPDGQGFSIDCDKVQEDLLDKHFHGTKLTSFLRSLNRWGYKRLFYHSMPKNTLSFHHPLFCKDSPGLSKDMNMAPCASGSSGASTAAASATAKSKKKAAPAPSPVVADVTESREPAEPVARQASPAAAAASAQPNEISSSSQSQPTTDLNEVVAQLRAQMAAQTAAHELLLKQAMAAMQQPKPQEPKPTLDINALLAQHALAQATASNQQPRGGLEGILASLLGGNHAQAQAQQPQGSHQPSAPPQLQFQLQQLQVQQQQQQPQVPSFQVQNVMQQLRNNTVTANTPQTPNLAALVSALAGGGSTAPQQQQAQAPSQADILQMLTPQQQLALLSQLSSSKK